MRLLNHFMWGEHLGRNKKTALLSAVIFVIGILGVLCNGASRDVTVYHNNQCTVVSSYFTSPSIILQKAGILLNGQGYDMSDTQNGLVLRVGPQYDLRITVDGETVTTTSRTDRVGHLLEQMGIVLGEFDRVTPSVDTIFSADTHIVVQRVQYTTVIQEESIEPEVIYEETNDLPIGAQSVKVPGEAGVAQVTYEQEIVDGAVVQSIPVVTVVLEEAKTRVLYKGTGDPDRFAPVVTTDVKVNTQLISPLQPNVPIAVNEKGQPLSYKKCMKGLATAYTGVPTDLTAVGERVRVGYIAVDPKEIPYGTMMFIKTPDGRYMYGLAKAVDTGGFVSGPVDVDLFFETEAECVQFGVRDVEIYIL